MKAKVSLLTYIVLILLVVGLNASEDISLSAILDDSETPFEESVELTLEIKWTGDIRSYAFEVLPLPELENLKILGTSSAISSGIEAGQEITTRTFKYTLKPTASGTGIIKPILLQCVSMPDSIPGELATQELSIKIADPVPIEKKSEIPDYYYFLLIIVLAGGFVFIFLQLRKKPETIPVKSPEESILAELAAIKQEGYSDRKLFFTRLFKMLSTFLEKKYNQNLSGQTADDIISNFEEIEISLDIKEKLTVWLTKAEKEKFAPMGGEPGDIIRLIAELEKFFKKNEISDKSEV